MLSREQNPEECDATKADSSNAAEFKIPFRLTYYSINC
jgi:hypothetical protein